MEDHEMHDLQRHVAENVPHRCTRRSAGIEFAARARGLDVDRYDRTIVLVTFPDAIVPFVNLNGPDTGRLGHLLCTFKDEQRQLWRKRGLSVAQNSVFVVSQPKRAARFAGELGWPVTVRPARLDGFDGVTTHVRATAGFQDAWQRALDAYGPHAGTRRILVEKRAPGEAFSLYVVGERVVAATHRPAPDVAVDVTDEVDPFFQQVAVDAVGAIPGLVHAEVGLVAPTVSAPPADPGPSGPPPYVLVDVDCVGTPVGLAPTEGQPRDIAGAIIDHYLAAPRWQRPRTVPHEPLADDRPAPGWIVPAEA